MAVELDKEIRELVFNDLISYLEDTLSQIAKVMTEDGFKMVHKDDPQRVDRLSKQFLKSDVQKNGQFFRYVVKIDTNFINIKDLSLFETYGFCKFVPYSSEKDIQREGPELADHWLMYFKDDLLKYIGKC